MTVHVTGFHPNGEMALCCDGSVRALVTIRHEFGQPVMQELISKAGDCGCSGEKKAASEFDLKANLRGLEVAPPGGKNDPDWKGSKYNESKTGPTRKLRRGEREDK